MDLSAASTSYPRRHSSSSTSNPPSRRSSFTSPHPSATSRSPSPSHRRPSSPHPSSARYPSSAPRLPKLTPQEYDRIQRNNGCVRCRQLNAGHKPKDCPLFANRPSPASPKN